MSESARSEIIRNKIKDFVQKKPDEFLKLAASIDRLARYILKGYFDEDEHCGLEMFIKATDKMESGERKWDFEKVPIEAMVYQTARSLLSNELVKKSKNKVTIELYEDLSGESMFDAEVNTNGTKRRRSEGTYSIQKAGDDEIIEMLKAELRWATGEADTVSLRVIEEILNSNIIVQREIAERLKIDEKEVRNSFDRIRRARDKVWMRLGRTDREDLESLKIEYRMKDKKDKSIEDEEERRE
jgi:hypothetical protein